MPKLQVLLIPNMAANNSWFDYKECIRGGFAITEDDLEKGRDLVECRGCSSWIRVSYEIEVD